MFSRSRWLWEQPRRAQRRPLSGSHKSCPLTLSPCRTTRALTLSPWTSGSPTPWSRPAPSSSLILCSWEKTMNIENLTNLRQQLKLVLQFERHWNTNDWCSYKGDRPTLIYIPWITSSAIHACGYTKSRFTISGFGWFIYGNKNKKIKQGGLMDERNYLLDLHTSPVANYLCVPPPHLRISDGWITSSGG
jgi:hypothetical protein